MQLPTAMSSEIRHYILQQVQDFIAGNTETISRNTGFPEPDRHNVTIFPETSTDGWLVAGKPQTPQAQTPQAQTLCLRYQSYAPDVSTLSESPFIIRDSGNKVPTRGLVQLLPLLSGTRDDTQHTPIEQRVGQAFNGTLDNLADFTFREPVISHKLNPGALPLTATSSIQVITSCEPEDPSVYLFTFDAETKSMAIDVGSKGFTHHKQGDPMEILTRRLRHKVSMEVARDYMTGLKEEPLENTTVTSPPHDWAHCSHFSHGADGWHQGQLAPGSEAPGAEKDVYFGQLSLSEDKPNKRLCRKFMVKAASHLLSECAEKNNFKRCKPVRESQSARIKAHLGSDDVEVRLERKKPFIPEQTDHTPQLVITRNQGHNSTQNEPAVVVSMDAENTNRVSMTLYQQGVREPQVDQPARASTRNLGPSCVDFTPMYDGGYEGTVVLPSRQFGDAILHARLPAASDDLTLRLCSNYMVKYAGKFLLQCGEKKDFHRCKPVRNNLQEKLRTHSLQNSFQLQLERNRHFTPYNLTKNQAQLILTRDQPGDATEHQPAMVITINERSKGNRSVDFSLYELGMADSQPVTTTPPPLVETTAETNPSKATDTPGKMNITETPDELTAICDNPPILELFCVDHCTDPENCAPIPCDHIWKASLIPYIDKSSNWQVRTSPFHDNNLIDNHLMSNRRMAYFRVNKKALAALPVDEQPFFRQLDEKLTSRLDLTTISSDKHAAIRPEDGYELTYTNLGWEGSYRCGGFDVTPGHTREDIPFMALSNRQDNALKFLYWDDFEHTNSMKTCLSPSLRFPEETVYSHTLHDGVKLEAGGSGLPDICNFVQKLGRPHWAQANFNILYDPHLTNNTRLEWVLSFQPLISADLVTFASSLGKITSASEFWDIDDWNPAPGDSMAVLENKFDGFVQTLHEMQRYYANTVQHVQFTAEAKRTSKGASTQRKLLAARNFMKGFGEVLNILPFGDKVAKGAKMIGGISKTAGETLGVISNGMSIDPLELGINGGFTLEHDIPKTFTSMIRGTGTMDSAYRSSDIYLQAPGSRPYSCSAINFQCGLPAKSTRQTGIVGFYNIPTATVQHIRSSTTLSELIVEGRINKLNQGIDHRVTTGHHCPRLGGCRDLTETRTASKTSYQPVIYNSFRQIDRHSTIKLGLSGFTLATNPNLGDHVAEVNNQVRLTISWQNFKRHKAVLQDNFHGDVWIKPTGEDNHILPDNKASRSRRAASLTTSSPAGNSTENADATAAHHRAKRGVIYGSVIEKVKPPEKLCRYTHLDQCEAYDELDEVTRFYSHSTKDCTHDQVKNLNLQTVHERRSAEIPPAFITDIQSPPGIAELGRFGVTSQGRPVGYREDPFRPATVILDPLTVDQANHLQLAFRVVNENCTTKCDAADFINGLEIRQQVETTITKRNNDTSTVRTTEAPIEII
ncbi:hypothetical protein [Endozoicomonas sp.]|uniref:hypothetical protein n=1 Tax=Endozoicomonas sp. TaxID=1892382 RepID=UPI00383AA6A5